MIFAWHAGEKFQAFMERELEELAEKVAGLIGSNLLALVLTGGYGRSEGGVIVVAGRQMPYNDLDLVLIVKNHTPDINSLLQPISEEWSRRLQIHVDFSRPLTLQQLKVLPHKLMWQDVLNGHIVLRGDPRILIDNMPEYLGNPIPAIEATHLLLNRGAGLIWSIGILEGHLECSEQDFVRRNYFKAALAIGDALLIAYSRHQTSYRGRDDLLAALADDSAFPRQDELLPIYRRALNFKFSPDDEATFKADLTAIRKLLPLFIDIFLFIESRRMGISFGCAAEYSATPAVREHSEHRLVKLPRNLYYNLRAGRLSLLYPRESLYRMMPALLSGDSREQAWGKQCRKFLAVWEKFN